MTSSAGPQALATDCGQLLADMPGMPNGVLALATALLGNAAPPGVGVGHSATTAWLEQLLSAPRRLDNSWPTPVAPVAVGDGWVNVEIIDDDRPLFEATLDQHGAAGAEEFSARCQAMRLPVCPYRAAPLKRQWSETPTAGPATCHGGWSDRPVDLTNTLVVDLTTHWAGPLTTKLLAEAGATVIKVDPDCRPDGFRDRPAIYQHLNGEKEIIDCDLRTDSGRQRFEQLVGQADLLIESFSRRVMGNLGYGPMSLQNLRPGLRIVSIKSFSAATPEADWLAYGPGVHATSGLTEWTDVTAGAQRPISAPIAYPDMLTGVAAYAASLSLLSAERAKTNYDVEVAMADVIRPLASAPGGTEPTMQGQKP